MKSTPVHSSCPHLRVWMRSLLLVTLLALPARAADYYVTVSGVSGGDGSNWAQAFPLGNLWTMINGATGVPPLVQPGDTVYLGGPATSGEANYGDYRLTISTSGTASARKHLIGVDRGFGFPAFLGAQGTRSYTTITLADTVSHWTIKNLVIEKREYGVATAGAGHAGITLEGITVRNVSKAAFAFADCDDLLVENCRAERYSGVGFKFNHSCDGVTVRNSVANCTGVGTADDPSWRASAASPVGFDFHNKNSTAPFNTDILLEDCVALHNNEDTPSDPDDYEQGDGFKMENRNAGVTLRRCISNLNQDAGFDLKGDDQLVEDCVAGGNFRYGFKLWYDGTLSNCVAVNNGARQFTLAATSSGNAITANYCTFHSATGQVGAVIETAGNSLTLNNSLITFANSAGTYTAGPGTFILGGTSKLANTANTANAPFYLDPTLPWDGSGTDFDNATSPAIGYNSAGVSSVTQLTVDNTDSSGVTITGSWSASTFTAGYHGSNYLTDDNTGKGAKSVRFTPTIPVAGNYDVFLRWTAGSNRASNVPVDIVSSSGTTTVTVNQTLNNGAWVPLGLFHFNAGASGGVLIRTTGTNGFVIADAAGFVAASSSIPSTASIVNSQTGKALRPYNAGSGDNVNIVQYAYASSWTSQHWQLADLGNGYHSIINVYTGKSLRPASSSTAAGANLTQYAHNSTWLSQQWELVPAGAGYGIVNRHSGLALRPLNGGAADDVQIVQEIYDPSDATMRWNIAAP